MIKDIYKQLQFRVDWRPNFKHFKMLQGRYTAEMMLK